MATQAAQEELEATAEAEGGGNGRQVDPCDCLAAYGSPSMNDADLLKLACEGLATCFSTEPYTLEPQSACLPFVVGNDATEREIEVYFFCSDICPGYGHVGVCYAGISDQAACCSVGGDPIIDQAWNSYVGCAPVVLDIELPGDCRR